MAGSNGQKGHYPPLHVGDSVRVLGGMFDKMEGIVTEIDEVKGRVTLMIEIYGKQTPVECERSRVTLIPRE